jgi:hypothetical protein
MYVPGWRSVGRTAQQAHILLPDMSFRLLALVTQGLRYGPAVTADAAAHVVSCAVYLFVLPICCRTTRSWASSSSARKMQRQS